MDQLSLTFAALSDPTRRAIVARLAAGHCTVTDLAEPFDMSMPAVTKHLKVLERAGLIGRSRDAQRRPCHLEAKPIKDVVDWAEQYRAIWEARLDRLDSYLREITAPGTKRGAHRKPTRNKKEKAHVRTRRS